MVGVAVVMFADRCTDYVDVKFSFEKEETKQLSCFIMLILVLFFSCFLQVKRLLSVGGVWVEERRSVSKMRHHSQVFGADV